MSVHTCPSLPCPICSPTVTILHRGAAQFPPIDPATIGRAFRDGRAHRFDGPPRHFRIGPPLNPVPTRGERITGYVATALALFILIYFGAEMLRGVL